MALKIMPLTSGFPLHQIENTLRSTTLLFSETCTITGGQIKLQ